MSLAEVTRREGTLGGAENEVRGLARGGLLNIVGALTSQLSLLAIALLLASVLGGSAFGRYAQAYAFLSLLGLLALSGFRAGLTRFVASHLAVADHRAVRSVIRAGLITTVAGGLLLAVGLYFAAPWISHTMLSDDSMQFPLRAVAVALPATTFADAALSATQGYRTMVPYAGIGLIVEPLTRLALTSVAVLAGFALQGVMTALVISSYAAAILAARALIRLTAHVRASARQAPPQPRVGWRLGRDVRDLYAFSSVSWMASLASTGLIWADTILLGILTDSRSVGVYNIATRLVILASFVMTPMTAAFGPRIADLHRRGSLDSLARTYTVATGWILRLSLPAFVLLLVFAPQMLDLVGPAYAAGATATVILAAGKLVDAGTGPCAVMLIMTGRPVVNMVDNITVLVLNVGLNLWLIPAYGLTGAAVAWAVSLAVVNAARVLQVWRALHMLPLDATAARGLLAGVLALQTAVIVQITLNGNEALVIGLLVVPLVYVAGVLCLGLSAEDRLAIRALLARRRRRYGQQVLPEGARP